MIRLNNIITPVLLIMKKTIWKIVLFAFLLTGCTDNNQVVDNSADQLTTKTIDENSINETIIASADANTSKMDEAAFTVQGFKCDIDRVMDEPDYELISIYECRKTDIELLTYKDEYTGNFNKNIILKAHDRYFVYDERVLFYEIIDDIEQYEQYGHSLVDPVHYIEDDFDGDGDIELACAFIMDRGSAYMNEKLMIFDYNKAEDEYDLYCLRFADFSDMAASVIAKHYDSGYTYEEISDGADGGIDSLAAMCMGRLYKEGAPSVSWGSWEEVTLDDGKPFKIIMHVYEYTGNIEELSKFVCNVSYLGNGEFAVEFADYSQDYINW
ncbi:MAG: hypothetical protein IJM37_06580 [Lachnospiraceae bacterium]|nr:hypothetical protein [Lachnospiraceae bacterium]